MTEGKSHLEPMRHSCEHVLTMAMLRLWPGKIKAAMGPATEEGFYFDFDSEIKISEDDFSKIEKEMAKIIKENLLIIKDEMTVAEAKKFFNSNVYKGNEYKHEWLDSIKSRGEKVSIYWLGEKGHDVPKTFVDICSGPHVKSTGKIGPFKLLKIAGAYWHGDEKNKMLQRIYGTCFATQADLDAYINQIEEAQKRDHRKLGKELGIFMLSPEVGGGLPLWLPKGAIVRDLLIDFMKKQQIERGYSPVVTPHIGKLDLYKTSGHYDNYRDHMYNPIKVDEEEFLLKAMNCPHHAMIYKNSQHSYRDLPVRLAEFGTVYRYEASGELSGLVRVRGFTQDDAHLFVRPDQLKDEFLGVLDLTLFVLNKLGFKDFRARLGLRDKKKDKYMGNDKLWDRAEKDIEEAVKQSKLTYAKEPGEAAFYGPKLDFVVKDVIGREWQLGTIQVDYNLPERFKLEYIDENSSAVRPVMIHRAPFGSLERFIGILIEHFAGAFPVWLAPVQAKILSISDQFNAYAKKVAEELKTAGMRVEIDSANESLGKKIRNAEMEKVPYMIVVGEKERAANTICVRDYATKKQEVMKTAKLIKMII
ncbi:threonine--tRNA ligase [Candidatus Peregrinibacteria bacterium]|nr:threonine--tRNA ligase [Candidatus Peregrinibacteria bacterium]